MLTGERLREVLKYEPDTGSFLWLVRRKGAKVGKTAGCQSNGYLVIRIDGVKHYCHRLAWLYMTGEWPDNQIDHRNGEGTDNRWSNLREATAQQNLQNLKRSAHNTSGFTGVSWCRFTSKWAAYIQHSGRKRHLGLFAAREDAHRAYLAAKAQIHTFQPTPRVEGAMA